MPITVQRLLAYEISDSNGNPTIETEVTLSNGMKLTSSVSTDNVINTYGLREQRDHDMQHYQGLGVKGAVKLINQVIAPRLANTSPLHQLQVDQWLNSSDGTEDKSKLGVNTMLAVSQVFAKAGAYSLNIPLYKYLNQLYFQLTKQPIPLEKIPTPAVGMLAGGKHAEFESFELIPSSSLQFSQAFELCTDIYHSMQSMFDQNQVEYSKNAFGEMIPHRNGNNEMIESILDTIQRKGIKLGKHLFMGLTINSKNFFIHGKYSVKDRPTTLPPNEFYNYLAEIIGKYSVLMIEDPFPAEDVDGWKKMFVNLGEQIYVVGHRYIGEKLEILEELEHDKTITAMVIKPLYCGTITDTFKMIFKARQKEMPYIISSDRGDTDDDFLADFAMAMQADFIKFGAPSQGERIAKYNRLLKIEQQAMRQAPSPTQPQGGTPHNRPPQTPASAQSPAAAASPGIPTTLSVPSTPSVPAQPEQKS